MISFCGCGLQTPESPTWDAQFVMPLIDHSYDMLELVDRLAEDALSYDSLGNIAFSTEQDFDTIAVDAGLTVPNLSTGFDESLGLIEVTGPEPVAQQLMLEDYIPLVLGDVGPATIDAAEPLPALAEIESATIASGTMIVRVTNDFGLPLDTVSVSIIDDVSAFQIGSVTFTGGIPNGQSRSETIDLSGKTISNSLSFESHMYTPGGTLFSLSENRVSVEASFSGAITVESATARVPAQQKDYTQEISFDDDNVIQNAQLKSGTLGIHVTNNTNLSAEVDITITEFRLGGEVFSFTATLLPQQTSVFSEDLSGYTLTPIPGREQPTVQVSTTADINGSGAQAVEVSSTDRFSVDVTANSLEFSSVSGVIQPTTQAIDPITEEVDLPKGFEDVSLPNALMTVDIFSAVNLPGSVSVHLEGDAGQEFDIQSAVNPGTVLNPGQTTILVDNLADFLDPIPSQITITGVAIVGDGQTNGVVTDQDFVYGTVTISSPLIMSIGETQFDSDINEMDTDDLDDEDVDRFNFGQARLQLTNHLPIGASVVVYLSGDSTTLYNDPAVTIGTHSVGAGFVDLDGLVTSSTTTEVDIDLTHEDLQVFKNDKVYVGQEISLDGTDGRVVRVLSTDYIDVRGYLTVSARLGDF